MSDDLDPSLKDRMVAATKVAVGAVPFVGGAIGELVSETIPGQRLDRVVAYLRELERRLSEIEQDDQKKLFSDPEKIEFVEEGGYQAARALSDDRITRIATAVANGLTSDDVESERKKRLLGLLGQLDDDELAILNAHGQSYGARGDDAWEKIRRPLPAHLGAGKSEVDEAKLYELGKENLFRLGLLEQKFSFLKPGEMPEFDKQTGRFKGRLEISYLGRMLLREIGLPSPIDAREGDK